MLSGMKQRTIRAAALCAILSASSVALAQSAPCPKFERGARYPWQTTEIMPGDRYTSIALDVDRSGFPIRCAFGKNNFPDPKTRTFERFVLIAGYDHFVADHKARKRWFERHPQERQECYPEPIRPDRLG